MRWTEFQIKLYQCPVPSRGGLKNVRISSFLMRILLHLDWMRIKKTPNTDTLYTVHNIMVCFSFFDINFKHKLVTV